MKRIAIVISTQYGQTAKVAERLQQQLEDGGHIVSIFRLRTEMDFPSIALDRYQGVLIGTPYLDGEFSEPVFNWTKLYARTLNAMPSGFFLVSFMAADTRVQARQDENRALASYREGTNLKPDLVASFGGAIGYLSLKGLKKWKLRKMCKAFGLPTDMSKDHELTDWNEVDQFAAEYSRIVCLPLAPEKALIADQGV